jgi:hypothetical protein
MRSHDRSGRTKSTRVTLVILGIVAAAVVACDGGPGTGDAPGLGLASRPDTDGGPITDRGPVLSGTDGSPSSTPGGDAGALPGLPGNETPATDPGPPVGGGDCGAIVARVLSCFPEIGGSDLEGIESSCNGVDIPPGCVSCVLGTWTCDDFQREQQTKCASACGGFGDSGSDGGTTGGDGGGGTSGGNTPSATCNDVVAAFIACDAETYGPLQQTIQQACSPFSNACKSCVAALGCSQLDNLAQGGVESTSCASTCGGSGGDGGTGGTSGSGGSSSGGSCEASVIAKGNECGFGDLSGSAGPLCSSLPNCANCLISSSCSDYANGACSSACDTGGGGSSGTGGSSSSDCVSSVIAKGNECGVDLSADAADICDTSPSCEPCLSALDCGSIGEGSCNSACNFQ